MLRHRRVFLAGSCAAFLTVTLAPRPSRAQAAASVFAEVAKGLLDTATDLDKIADGLVKLVARADKVGFPKSESKRIHNHLNDMLERSKSLLAANERLSNLGKDFIERGPDEAKWKEIQAKVSQILEWVRTLLEVEKQRGDFARAPIDDAWLKIVQNRVDLLTKLQALPVPQTRAELDKFKLVLVNYDVLIASLRRTNEAFAKYLHSMK